MAHNDFINPSGTWAPLSLLSPAQMAKLDLRQYQTVNGDSGGVWAPRTPITIGGQGVFVTDALVAGNAQITIPLGKFVTISPGATFSTAQGSVSTLSSPVALYAPLNVGAGGRISCMANTELQAGSLLQVDSGATVDLTVRGTLRVEPGMFLDIEGVYGNAGVVRFERYSRATFQQASSLVLQPGSTLILDGAASLTSHLDVTNAASVTLEQDATLALQQSASLQNGATKTVRTGPETRMGWSAMTGHRIYPNQLPDADAVVSAAYDIYWLLATLSAQRTYSLSTTNPTPPVGQTIVFSRVGPVSGFSAVFHRTSGAPLAALPAVGQSWVEFSFNGLDWNLARWGGMCLLLMT